MRTLEKQEVSEVAGGQPQLAIDINIPAKHIHINVVEGDQIVFKIVNLDWSKMPQA